MKSIFSFRLKKLREQKNIRQTELANILDVTQSAIAKFETGRQEPTMNQLLKLANYFGVDLNYLFGSDFDTALALHEAKEKEMQDYKINYSQTEEDELGYFTNWNEDKMNNDDQNERNAMLYNSVKISEQKLKEIYNIEPNS